MGKGEVGFGLLGESKWFLGWINEPFQEKMGIMLVYGEVRLGVVSTSSLHYCDESIFPGPWNSLEGNLW